MKESSTIKVVLLTLCLVLGATLLGIGDKIGVLAMEVAGMVLIVIVISTIGYLCFGLVKRRNNR